MSEKHISTSDGVVIVHPREPGSVMSVKNSTFRIDFQDLHGEGGSTITSAINTGNEAPEIKVSFLGYDQTYDDLSVTRIGPFHLVGDTLHFNDKVVVATMRPSRHGRGPEFLWSPYKGAVLVCNFDNFFVYVEDKSSLDKNSQYDDDDYVESEDDDDASGESEEEDD